nr:hypothetical protein [Nanoarchaeum sp.]
MDKRVIVLISMLFIIPFVSSEYYSYNGCGGGGSLPVLDNLIESPEYCIDDADCTLELRKTCGGVPCTVSSLSLQSGYGPGLSVNNPPYYYFSSSDCTTPQGCVLPYNWGVSSFSIAVFTIPASTYSGGAMIHVEQSIPCPGGVETIGYRWNHLNTLNNLDAVLLDGACYPNLPCDVKITLEDQGRDFIDQLTVTGRQSSNFVHFLGSDEQGSPINSITDNSFVITIPANTFISGDVELNVYDLTNKIPFSEQEGAVVSIRYSSSSATELSIDVSPEECSTDATCEVAVHVNRVLNIPTQHIIFMDSIGNQLQVLLSEPGVTYSGTTVYYTLPVGFYAGQMIVRFVDSFDSSSAEETIMMIDPLVPSFCGDSLIQNPNDDGVYEQCDLSELGGYGCTSYPGSSFTGGTLSCNIPSSVNECRFNTSLCTGVYSDCGDHSITGSEDCDFDSDGELMFPAGINDCDDVHSGWTGELDCDSDCDYDGCSDPDTTGPGNTNNPPIVGPDQYLLNGDCVEDGVLNDEFGVLTWTVYNQFGQATPQTGVTKCVLESEKIPFFGIYSMLVFVLVLVGFYGFRKKQ